LDICATQTEYHRTDRSDQCGVGKNDGWDPCQTTYPPMQNEGGDDRTSANENIT
jgi:hypothetical protein